MAMRLGVILGNRTFFPDQLISEARAWVNVLIYYLYYHIQ